MSALEIFEKIKAEAKRLLKRSRSSHDWEHTERVYKLAMRIAKTENADLETVRYSALLHDIARNLEDKNNGRVDHAEQGAILAENILKKHNFTPDKIQEIIHCIQTHRFRGDKRPKSLEAKVLFDADKLDSIGAVGIARAFLFAGEIGSKVHNKDIDIEKTRAYTSEDTAYREFIVKLRKVKNLIKTREGRRLARERHRFMVEFFTRLNKEVDGVI